MNIAIKPEKTTIVILGLGFINILIHLAFYGNLEFHRDELLYFSLGMHPAFGYATVPPLVSWIASMMQFLIGYSLLSVKLFPALMSGVFVLLSAGIAKELGGKSGAQILTGVAVIVMPVTLRVFHLFQPVFLDLVFWTSIFYIAIRYVNDQNDRHLILLGAVTGLAMLNKYLVALLVIALLLSILFTRYREIYGKPSFYLGLGAGLLIFLPNLMWQIAHGLPVIRHMRELNEYQLVHVNRMDFLIDQLIMPLGSSLIMLTGIAYLWFNRKYRFIAVTALLVVLSLLLLRGKSYYTMGIFPVLIAAGAVAIEKYVKNKWMVPAITVLLILLSLPPMPFGIPVYGQNGMVKYFQRLEDRYGMTLGRRFEDGTIHSLPQDYADQIGWEELTKIVDTAYEQVPDKEKCLIYCENYGQAGAVTIIGKKYGLPEPVSFHGSFVYWVPQKFDPDIEYFIYVNDEPGEDVKEFFRNILEVGKISNVNAREYGTAVYLCSDPKGSFNREWQSILERVMK